MKLETTLVKKKAKLLRDCGDPGFCTRSYGRVDWAESPGHFEAAGRERKEQRQGIDAVKKY